MPALGLPCRAAERDGGELLVLKGSVGAGEATYSLDQGGSKQSYWFDKLLEVVQADPHSGKADRHGPASPNPHY